MCHAPIVLPEVGGGDARSCRATTRAMREVAERLVASAPDRLVLLSPHAPRSRSGWGAVAGPYKGDLHRFRAPQVRVDLPVDTEALAALGLLEVSSEEGFGADHGAMVPLAFLTAAGWQGPTVVLALPWGDDPDITELVAAIAALPGRTAVLASGDMSHRLMPGAPAGYRAVARDFDAAFVAALRAKDWERIQQPGALPHRGEAAEDVVVSTRVALAAAESPENAEVLSYEGPWGVGYTEAIFQDPTPPLYAVARQALAAAVRGEVYVAPVGGLGPRGVFVTLHGPEGELRGCIGHIEPTRDRLYEEVAAVAPLAGLEDPRFAPVTEGELAGLSVEVSVLSPPEPIPDLVGHDPKRHGLIVSAGGRAGLLLPDLDGVDTAEQQLEICKGKGRIPAWATVQLERFSVEKIAEPAAGEAGP